MGCDIHAHIEIKVNGQWHHWGHPRLERWYGLFSKMAGVRARQGDSPAIAPGRGIPEDATFSTKFDYKHWGPDAHDASWMSSEEVAQLVEYVDARKRKETGEYYSFEHTQLGYIFGNGWGFKQYPSGSRKGYYGQPEELEDARLIFWFDC